MRIGLMLRAYDESGGIGVYTRNLVAELLRLDRQNHYVLLYRRRQDLGHFRDYANVTECLIPGANRAIWDQLAVPYYCWRQRVDVVFHSKFTAPLLAPCRAVMVVHGADWLIAEQAQYYSRANVLLMRAMLPLYFRKCSLVISVSQNTTNDFERALRLPPGKLRTVYFGPARQFRRITEAAALSQVKARYRLPDRFILHLTKRGGARRKNLAQVFQAYARYHAQARSPHKLVVGCQDGERLRIEYGLPAGGYGADIHFPGWLDQEDLPAVYTLADLYLCPSQLEAFPIPITEAMTCGTPVITSRVNGLQEISGEAALLVSPDDIAEIAAAIERVLTDAGLRASLAAKGRERASLFTWDRCARETLALLNSLAPQARLDS
jgi:glycosyltransferase involved in cell wall biosynthesis